MKVKDNVYSLFFCALVSFAFAHEYVTEETESTSDYDTEVEETIYLPEGCDLVCDRASSALDEGLSIIANDESKLIAVVNSSAGAAFIVDVKSLLLGLRDDNTGWLLVINLTSGRVESVTSIGNAVPFRKFLSSLKQGLRPILESNDSVQFELASISSENVGKANDILRYLIKNIEGEFEINPKLGLQLAISLAEGFWFLQSRSLQGFIETLGVEGISVPGDLRMIYNVQVALGTFFSKIPGGIPGLRKKGVKINLSEIGQAQNGLQILSILFRNIGKAEDLGKDLGHLLNDPESFFKFIAQLGGNLNIGVGGLLKVGASILEFLNKDTSLEEVINVLIQVVSANRGLDINLTTQLKQSLSELIKAVDKAEYSDTLSGLVDILKALKKGKFKVDNVDISEIISELISSVENPDGLEVIIHVLKELEKIVEIEQSLPRLLLVLILDVNSPIGIDLLRGLGIKIDINLKSSPGGILKYIVKSVPDVEHRMSKDVYDALCSLPIIKEIVKTLSRALSSCRIKDDLKELLWDNELVSNLIRAAFQVIGGLKLRIPDDATSRIRKIVEQCSSVYFYLGVESE